MEWFIVAVAVVALGVAAVVAAGGGGSMASEPVRDTYAMALRDEPFDADTVRHLRFGVALRGYAMEQVDVVLDRLARDLADRDDEIGRLRAALEERGCASAGLGAEGADERDDAPDVEDESAPVPSPYAAETPR